jgi:hypothetical protein
MADPAVRIQCSGLYSGVQEPTGLPHSVSGLRGMTFRYSSPGEDIGNRGVMHVYDSREVIAVIWKGS